MSVLSRRQDKLLLVEEAERPHDFLPVCARHADAVLLTQDPAVLRRPSHEGQGEGFLTTAGSQSVYGLMNRNKKVKHRPVRDQLAVAEREGIC